MAAPISVVMPAYNAAEFIEEALLSVLAQTLPPSEIIVVDDGSDDDTAIIAGRLAKVIRYSHTGVSAARNAGVNAASEPWIAFLDADDIWLPTKLERQTEAVALAPDAGIIASAHRRFNTNGDLAQTLLDIPAYQSVHKQEVGPGIVALDHESNGAAYVRYGNFLQPSSVMVRRDALLRIGGFDESMSHSEDHDMLLRLLKRERFVVVEDVLVRMRAHQANASQNWAEILAGSAEATRKILVTPEAYPSEVVRIAKTEYPSTLRALTVELWRTGKFSRALEVMHRGFATEKSLHNASYLVIANLLATPPGGAIHRLSLAAYRAAMRRKR